MMNVEDFDDIVEALLRSNEGGESGQRLREWLADDEFLQHLVSAEWGDGQAAISRLMCSSVFAGVIMEHSDEELRCEAANWLSNVEDEAVRMALIERAAHDQADLVRASAAEAIAEHALRSRLSATALHLLADDDVLVRSLAVEAAKQQGLEQVVREMLLTESEDRVIVNIHGVLAADGDDASAIELYSLLANSDYVVRCRAMDALAHLARVRDTPRFHRAVLDLASRDPARAVSSRAKEICRELGLPVVPVP